jgi:hypothetical protein
MGNTKIDGTARPAQIYQWIIADSAQQFFRPISFRFAAAWATARRTVHTLARRVDARASGSVRVDEIDAHKSGVSLRSPAAGCDIFCSFNRTL